jgi:Fe-S cluster assembly protein SufD
MDQRKIERIKFMKTRRPPEILNSLDKWFEETLDAFEPEFQKKRYKALEEFKEMGFPHSRLEKWRNSQINTALSFDYKMYTQEFNTNLNEDDFFKCDVHELDAFTINLFRGYYVYKDNPIFKMSNGAIVGSISAAFKKYPELIDKHFGKYIPKDQKKPFNLLNTALFLDGLFLYLPKNTKVDIPIQLINAVGKEENAFVQNRNLIIMEEGSNLTLIQCDDSYDYKRSFTNSLSEFYIGKNASLKHFKIQNINNNSFLVNSDYFHQEKDSILLTNRLIFNGGLIRNEVYSKLNGTGAESDIQGLYLADKNQHIDNQVIVDHAVPHCQSNELFKGIIDDYASAIFNGHILVRKDAQKTNAFQNNNNIVLSDKAKVNSKPFLEIYADDVKCSHGSTLGQLDEDALFYIRQRGIGLDNARLLLMYAFAAEVIASIDISSLYNRIDDMIKKRLRGELSICDQCVLHCSSPEYNFEIDLSKIN